MHLDKSNRLSSYKDSVVNIPYLDISNLKVTNHEGVIAMISVIQMRALQTEISRALRNIKPNPRTMKTVRDATSTFKTEPVMGLVLKAVDHFFPKTGFKIEDFGPDTILQLKDTHDLLTEILADY